MSANRTLLRNTLSSSSVLPQSKVIPDNGSNLKPSVAICDGCPSFLAFAKRKLQKESLGEIHVFAESSSLLSFFDKKRPDLFLINIFLMGENGFDLVDELRISGYSGLIAMISVDFSLETVERAAWSGVDDILIKTSRLNLPREVDMILKQRDCPPDYRTIRRTLPESAFFRCIGLSDFELLVLISLFPNFPTQKELAFNLGRSEGYIRKVFSSIYNKLHISGQAQLSRMLTFCSRFSRLHRIERFAQPLAHEVDGDEG